MLKRCPTCSRVYDDVSLQFCQDDGTVLENKPPESAPETLVMPGVPENQPTITVSQPPLPPSQPPPTATAFKSKRRKNLIIWILIVALGLPFVGGVIAAGWMILKRPALKWHLVMRVLPSNDADQTDVVNQTVAVLKNRLNAAGVSHFEIKPQGDQILLDLPAIDDPERIKQLISTSGKLELVHVISSPNPAPAATYNTREEALASLNSGETIPTNRRLLQYAARDDADLKEPTKWVVVAAPAIVSGKDLRNASATKSANGESYQVSFSLNQAGAQKFGSWTGANINEYLGVVLNDEVKSIAYIQSQITDQGQITGRFTKPEAEDLALVLKSGALPARLEFLEERVDK